MSNIQPGNQTLGRGKVLFSAFVGTTYVPAGYRYLGNTPSFNLSAKSDTLAHYNSDAGVRVKDRQVTTTTDLSGSLDCDDIQIENIALYFLGTSGTVTQTSATAIVETFTGVLPGLLYQLGITAANPSGVRSISNVSVTVAGTAKVLNTDYTIDAVRGTVTIVATSAGGTIASGAVVLVTYDRAAKSRDQVISGSTPVKGSIKFQANNPEGAQIDFHLPYVVLSPNGDYALKADNDWQKISFTCDILAAPGYERVYADGVPY